MSRGIRYPAFLYVWSVHIERLFRIWVYDGETPMSQMGYNLAEKNMSEQTAQCKWCGRYFSLSILAQFGGYCSPACFQAGMQRQR